MVFLRVAVLHSFYYILCEGGIEKSVSHDHRLSSIGKPCDAKADPVDGFLYPTLTLMIDPYKLHYS